MEPRRGLVDEVASRAHLPRGLVGNVLEALAELDEGRPARDEVEQLIERARHHALGVRFLVEGNVEAVAITFRAHVLDVEAARRRLADTPAAP